MSVSTNSKLLVACDHLSLQFGRVQALRELDLQIHAGECIAIVGANGSGKTSLLRVLHGLVSPAGSSAMPGKAQLRGQVLRRTGLVSSLVFQRPWMPRTRVHIYLRAAAWLAGTRWPATRELAMTALHQVDLADLAQRSCRSLSAGQQQRLGIALAWIRRPSLLLLDEPTSNLSPSAAAEVEQLIQQLQRQGVTIVFSSHQMPQVQRWASRVIHLAEGKCAFDGPGPEFFRHITKASEGRGQSPAVYPSLPF